jgi:hypothetical protein
MTKIGLAALALGTALLACASESDRHDEPNLTVTISGEGSALTGFSFPAAQNEPGFVDGWDVKFDRILVTVDNIVLTDQPDMSPTDQSVTGATIAKATGPWAVDMTKPGKATEIRPSHETTATEVSGNEPSGITDDDHAHGTTGKNPDAQQLVKIQGVSGNTKLDPSVRYGFGFDIVSARADATKTNLDGAGAADYAEMVSKGWAVLYVGTATFKGGADCKSSDATSETRYDFTALPKTVKFRFGFKTPTQYLNCQNTDLRGKPFDGEEAQRGVQVDARGNTIAQITLHVDHPFWNTVDHDGAELFFDQMAALASPDGTLTLDDLSAADFTSFKDRKGAALPWRSCVATKEPKQGTRAFDSGSVAVNPNASPENALRHYADFVSYQQSTEGHLNADGLCAVKRLFPAPR